MPSHNHEIDQPGPDGRRSVAVAHSSLISLSSQNTSGKSDRKSETDLVSSIPILTETLSYKPSRHTDGLEFIHITKNAGGSIEAAAADAGIIFGACHWLKLGYWGFGPGCNQPDKRWDLKLNRTRMPYQWRGRTSIELWHVPWHWFRDDHNPYQFKSLLAVIRNPYERILSEFFYFCKSPKYAGLCNDTTSKTMNNFIQKESVICLHGKKCAGHFLPQHDYVYDMEGNQVIDHLLRFEL